MAEKCVGGVAQEKVRVEAARFFFSRNARYTRDKTQTFYTLSRIYILDTKIKLNARDTLCLEISRLSPTRLGVSLKKSQKKKEKTQCAAPVPARERAIAASHREEEKPEPPEVIAIFSIGWHVNAVIAARDN